MRFNLLCVVIALCQTPCMQANASNLTQQFGGVTKLATTRATATNSAVIEHDNSNSVVVAAVGSIEVAFSPNEGSQALIIRVIDQAKLQLLVLSYSFTSAAITQALTHAIRRGVKVTLVADHKHNVQEDATGKARAALSTLASAGADVRTIRAYPIHHDKVIVADGRTVQLGSFNYSEAAQRSNSENVLVNWNNPELAKVYTEHFKRNYMKSKPFAMAY